MGASVLLVGLAAYQAADLSTAARNQATIEHGSRGLISAAVPLYVADPARVDLAAQPDGKWAPYVTLGDLAALYKQGKLPITTLSPSDLATERALLEPCRQPRASPPSVAEVVARLGALRHNHQRPPRAARRFALPSGTPASGRRGATAR
jgi:hypothetical protein